MIRRTIFLAVLVLIVISASVWGYLNLNRDPDLASPYRAMPLSTSAVLTVNDYTRTFDNLLMNNLMWQELSLDQDVNQFGLKIRALDSLIRTNAWSSENAEELKWYVSFLPSGKDFDHCIIIPVEGLNKGDFRNWFDEYCKATELYAKFENVEIIKGDFSDDLFGTVYFSTHKGLLLASFSPNIVEDAIRTLNGDESLYTNKNFRNVEKTSGSFADWNFFLNYQDVGSLKLLGLDIAELAQSDVLWTDWTALDATVHPDLILLNGFSNSSETSFLSLFDKQKSQDVDVIEIIPEDARLFFHFGVSNYQQYCKTKREYFKKIGKADAYKNKVEKYKQVYGFDLENEFEQWVSNEFGLIYLNHPELEAEDSKVAFFRLKDIRRTQSVLDDLADIQYKEVEDLTTLIVDGDFFDGFEINLFKGIEQPFYLILDKYLLLSSNSDLLVKMRKDYLSANTLKKSESYASFASNLSDQSNVYVYVHLINGQEVYQDLLDDESLAFINENPTFTKKFEQLGIQFKDGKKNLFYQHMAMNFNPQQRSQGKTLWELALDTHMVMKPAIVYNHYTNAREILVQDAANKIYLIDNKGNVIWKRQMKERIRGEVFQIDVYKNNKLQMLFSGESSIYLLDRKGRDVENFPVQLPALATSNLKVIDYEKNREYRILIGIRGGEVLNFDRFGKKIKGWSYKSGDEISYPINYFLLNNKDYIVMVGEEGRPYVLNRRGEERLNISETLPTFNQKDYVLELSNDINQCKFVTTDESGNFVKLRFNGEKEIVNLDMISDNHKFLYDDVNNDQKSDYILLDSNKLMVYTHAKEKLFEVELEGNDPQFLNMYRFQSGYGKIGFTDQESGQVYLYRDAGGLDSNFPLKGNTAFTITDINKDGRFNLLVGSGNKLVVYNLK